MGTVGRLVLAWLALVTVACGDVGSSAASQGADSDRSEARGPLDGEWDLVAWTDQGDPVDAEQAGLERVHLHVDGLTARGHGPCNSHGASLEVDGTALRIAVGNVTLRGCPDRPDGPYFDALERIESYERDDDRLVLVGAETRLVFEETPPVPDAPLAGTTWTLSSLYRSLSDDPAAGTETADVPTSEGEEPTLVLGDDGEFTAETGCRQLTGRWERDGDHLLFRDVAAGDGACGDPDLEDVEARQLEVFESRMELEINGNLLDLFAGQHGLGYIAPAESAETG